MYLCDCDEPYGLSRHFCQNTADVTEQEVAKTRLQLDGELQSRAGSTKHVKVYNNAFDALRKIWHYEGLSGIQRGLGAAYAYQILLYASSLPDFRRRLS